MWLKFLLSSSFHMIRILTSRSHYIWNNMIRVLTANFQHFFVIKVQEVLTSSQVFMWLEFLLQDLQGITFETTVWLRKWQGYPISSSHDCDMLVPYDITIEHIGYQPHSCPNPAYACCRCLPHGFSGGSEKIFSEINHDCDLLVPNTSTYRLSATQ
jgi:hypothetical protein